MQKESITIRKKKISKFLKKNDKICNSVFSKHLRGEEKMWMTKKGKKVIAKARKKIGYSDKTGSRDIFVTLLRNYFA